ncbi:MULTISPECIES: hypothetical protein [Enterobacter]|uniref:hypothetical protein n=1 Tax=Enterobacter TaxID=547 RepID=UPI000F0B1724|nr:MULTISPECIES: hypothetical protein [Enterobacter]AYU97727.1 hypothetical protein EEI76_22020 [Enterobacter cloacae]MCG7803947.1 hypothetical protein [Enterobacter asburiae]UAN18875.1 hypothetical protein KGP20_24530 [Enterobacter asburiae]UAN24831.1 hypothetical protein KGP25_24915 [Enterobacter sp. JBIWA003]UAN34235.1 hypothetical protein KGP22_23115 [Enterobacter sp. JBIWA005]
MTGYVTGFSIKIVVLMIVTQLVVYVTTLAVTGFGKIQVSGVEPQHDGDKSFSGTDAADERAELREGGK